ncbi:hypothetical protein PILCRDRAFT_99293 [Piloderma croceum F 1598]|uniref:Major facilitator superfamily (MFS) profile domain-containing protein n=1 Tax=Piloderma croceum (strain F 1598) TaxID=765440 RepID=A0A0C3B8I4_PILCF|nr:hypothetical protein PILCRDRAFT_99293 [Piloderma croceum F 1598]
MADVSISNVAEKNGIAYDLVNVPHMNHAQHKHGKYVVGEGRVHVSAEDNNRILRATDKTILMILIWVYFLQILDKSVLGYSSIFGLQKEANLSGYQYSFVGSISAVAQLALQPLSAFLIVRVPVRILMPALLLGWGTAQCAMAACTNYQSLLATRFFLGLFEAANIPLFSIVTSLWYRRSEQPMRIAAWYGANGAATIIGSVLAYGFGHIKSSSLYSYQLIFLFVGLVTVVTVPFVYWKMDNTIALARFICDEDKPKAIQRLRANQTGTGTNEFKWRQVFEAALECKTYLWILMSFFLNVGASVSNTFGPLILSGLGFDAYTTSLLNVPFGAVQLMVILLSSYAAYKFRTKSIILTVLVLPVVAGLVMLYALGRDHSELAALIVAYYFLACLFGGIPLIASWMIGNTAGQTKKSVVMSAYNAGASVGNFVGPLLFNASENPTYYPGLRATLGFFVAFAIVIGLQVLNLMSLNKANRARRVRNGKPADPRDLSMVNKYVDTESDHGQQGGPRIGTHDLTDAENDEFIFIY